MNDDFYFVYFPIGYDFVKTMECTFKYIPEDINVIVITNNLSLINAQNVKFNLTVLHIDDLRDEWSLKNEKLIYATTPEEYRQQLKNGNVKFPYSAHRFVIPWLLKEKNATKFALLDSDCLINYNGNVHNSLHSLDKAFNGKNVFFGKTYTDVTFYDTLKLVGKSVFSKYNLNSSVVDEMEDMYVVFDGFLRGFWFNEKQPLETFFNIWNELVRNAHEYNVNYLHANTIIADEWIHGFAIFLTQKLFNINVVNENQVNDPSIIKHVYHPENMYFKIPHLFYKKIYDIKESLTREEFFKSNLENLKLFYKNQNAIDELELKNVIYDWKDTI